MRSPPTPLGTDRPSFECRVRFSGRLFSAVIAPVDETPMPRPHPRVAVVPPVSSSPAPVAEPIPAAPTAQLAVPADFWQTDLARELKADRIRIEDILGRLQEATTELRKDQTERLQQWQRAAVELAMTVATRLLHERVVSGDFPMEAKVRDMVAQLEDEAPVAIRLNPADLQLLESRLGDVPLLPGRDDPRLIPDPTLARGECRVEGKEAMLLSDVGRELQEIRDELLRSLAHARS
jgi:hypothetical protein